MLMEHNAYMTKAWTDLLFNNNGEDRCSSRTAYSADMSATAAMEQAVPAVTLCDAQDHLNRSDYDPHRLHLQDVAEYRFSRGYSDAQGCCGRMSERKDPYPGCRR